MLKIEVIKFEAQDVITTSVACVCNDKCWYHHESFHANGVADHNYGPIQCPADSHPNCFNPANIA